MIDPIGASYFGAKRGATYVAYIDRRLKPLVRVEIALEITRLHLENLVATKNLLIDT